MVHFLPLDLVSRILTFLSLLQCFIHFVSLCRFVAKKGDSHHFVFLSLLLSGPSNGHLVIEWQHTMDWTVPFTCTRSRFNIQSDPIERKRLISVGDSEGAINHPKTCV